MPYVFPVPGAPYTIKLSGYVLLKTDMEINMLSYSEAQKKDKRGGKVWKRERVDSTGWDKKNG